MSERLPASSLPEGPPASLPGNRQAPDRSQKSVTFPRLRDPHYPVHRIADQLEPYLRVIVEKFHPGRIILFGSQAYGRLTEHSDL